MDQVVFWCCVAFLAAIAAYIGCILYASYSYAKGDAAARSAQELEIAEGVTLMRGLLAFFGRGSRWKVSKGLVYVESWFADEDEDEDEVELVLCVDPKSGRIEVVSCRLEGQYDAESLIDALAAASKG